MRRFLSIAFLPVCSVALFGQGGVTTTLQVQNSGSTVFTRSGFIRMNFTAGCTASVVSGSLNLACTGSANNPGGTANQIQYNNAGTSFAGFTMGGDCTIVVSTGVITCTKTNGSTFAASATTDTTNATNIGSGTLNAARLPAAVVLNNQANAFGAFLQDFSSSTIKLPIAPGCVTTANGNVCYDSTANNWHFWQNGADRINPVINGSTTNGNCAKFVVAGSTVSLQDAGAPCGGGGGGSVNVNGSAVTNPNFNGTTPAAGANNLNLTWQFLGSNVSAEVPVSGNTTSVASAGTGLNTAPSGTNVVADGSGNIIPQAKVSTVGLGGLWSNGAPLGITLAAGANSTLVNGTMYVQQVSVGNQLTIGNATFDVVTCASCAEVINTCLYDSAGSTLLWSGVSATFNAPGAISATGTQATIVPGVYYFAYSSSGTTAPVIQGYVSGGANTDIILNKNGVRQGTAANGISGGLCPSSLGVLTPTTGSAAHGTFALEP